MQALSEQQLDALLANAKVLIAEKRGVKIAESPKGEMIKVFTQRKRWSSARLLPHAVRFKRNAQRLRQKGFASVDVRQLYYCASRQVHVALYPKIPGITVREWLADHASEKVTQLIHFLVELHQQGVLFRGIHLGNILITPSQQWVLIDVVNVKFSRRSLSLWQRMRNLRHLLRDPGDHESFKTIGILPLLTLYGQAAGMSSWQQRQIQRYFAKNAANLLA